MGYAAYLKDLLRPMRVYRLDHGPGGAELDATGRALDDVAAVLDQLQREMLLTTAQDQGLEAIERLLVRRPVTKTLQARRDALAALLRIGGDSFTPKAINDNLKGCGLNVVASETGRPEEVEIHFPDVPGIPSGFEDMKKIIEDILPCHLNILYRFWFITWALMEQRFHTWGAVEARNLSWGELEVLVQ